VKKKLNQAQPEGLAHPEIRPGDIWRDNHGSEITISDVAFNRVVYYRNGYLSPCICSPDRLRREFIFVSTGISPAGDLYRVMQATSGAERIQVMREIIQQRGKAK
jgi:hypothetical protein